MNEEDFVTDPVTQIEIHVPSFATPEDAIRRESARSEGSLRTIRFFPDLTHNWSLWEVGSEQYAISAKDLNLSEDLAEDLESWHDEWENAVTMFGGWPTGQAHDAWQSKGDDLVARIRREVWEFADVVAEHRL